MDRLREIDKFSQHNLYQHKIEEIVQGYHRQSKPWEKSPTSPKAKQKAAATKKTRGVQGKAAAKNRRRKTTA